MLTETGPIIFYDQKFDGVSLPEGDDVSEAIRLRAAAVGVYELQLRQQPHYEFSGAFLFDDQKAQRRQKQFEVSEDITEDERSLTIQSAADAINLDSLEIIPLDWRGDPLEFTPLETSKSQRKISYRKDAPVESLKLKLSGLNVFEIESIRAVLWANGRDYSPGKLSAVITRSEDIRLDRLDNSGGARTVEEHLNALFHVLLEKAPDRIFDIECNYRYYAVAGGPHVLVPVVFQRSQNLETARNWFSDLSPILNNWYRDTTPPEGVFDFAVKVYGALSREPNPILHLTGIVLPIKSIAGWG